MLRFRAPRDAMKKVYTSYSYILIGIQILACKKPISQRDLAGRD